MKLIIGFLLILLILASWFYWFEIRPSNIRKQCIEIALEKPRGEIEDWYRLCLRQEGLDDSVTIFK